MDDYFREFISAFFPGRPYASLIYSRSETGKRRPSGQVISAKFLERVLLAGQHLETIETPLSSPRVPPPSLRNRLDRASELHGTGHAARLWNSTVAMIGVGGTGSAAAHMLARAGVGDLILVDPDRLEASNLEQVHGSTPAHLEAPASLKVKVVVSSAIVCVRKHRSPCWRGTRRRSRGRTGWRMLTSSFVAPIASSRGWHSQNWRTATLSLY